VQLLESLAGRPRDLHLRLDSRRAREVLREPKEIAPQLLVDDDQVVFVLVDVQAQVLAPYELPTQVLELRERVYANAFGDEAFASGSVFRTYVSGRISEDCVYVCVCVCVCFGGGEISRERVYSN
jgi:hypothetical protein